MTDEHGAVAKRDTISGLKGRYTGRCKVCGRRIELVLGNRLKPSRWSHIASDPPVK